MKMMTVKGAAMKRTGWWLFGLVIGLQLMLILCVAWLNM